VERRGLLRVLRPAEGGDQVRVRGEVHQGVELVGRAALGEAGPDVVERRGLLRVLRPAEGGDQVRVRGEVHQGVELVGRAALGPADLLPMPLGGLLVGAEGGDQVRVRGDVLEGVELVVLLGFESRKFLFYLFFVQNPDTLEFCSYFLFREIETLKSIQYNLIYLPLIIQSLITHRR
jgi:hypothetical protein